MSKLQGAKDRKELILLVMIFKIPQSRVERTLKKYEQLVNLKSQIEQTVHEFCDIDSLSSFTNVNGIFFPASIPE